MGAGGLLPSAKAAPRGVIADFLRVHPEFVSGQGRLQNGMYVPQGRSFPMAWHHLSREAQTVLASERLAGMYSSESPAAPYWLIAERGMGQVGVPARRMIENSRSAVNRAIPSAVARTWGNL